MDTGCLGGVPHPTEEELAAMQKGQYILHACGGELTQVAVEKIQLPHDPQGHLQCVNTALGPDGVIYVNQISIMCKSTDGGQTWTSHERDWPGGELAGWLQGKGGNPEFNVLSDGTFIAVTRTGERSDPMEMWASSDEGRSWQQISQIELPGHDSRDSYTLFRSPDDTLLYGVGINIGVYREGTLVSSPLLAYCSTDQGNSWQGPSQICDWGSEGGIVQLPSGGLLAVIRYGPGYAGPEAAKNPDFPRDAGKVHKTIWLADSDDEGRSWQNFRQLTTVQGQCYGYPAALGDGTVVVTHDTRYGPGTPGGRAMVSYDEGQAWEDEVYYVYYGTAQSGYSQNVVLEDDLILTICGTSDYEGGNPGAWDNWIGNSDLTAIRWRPTKD